MTTPELRLTTPAELQDLAARLRFDLESAGFAPVPPDREDDEEGGVRIFVSADCVHVAWSVHDRLGEAALDTQDAGRLHEDVVCRHETVRTAIHLALANILNAFGYSTRPRGLGFGHVIVPNQT
ncbi:hypothetical protein ABT274_34720 [Streptomyces sp. NPDC001127]|uniref:hypothetical protein n=1 Tax=Streptomyces sp. NPDC001127 TaxID=3154377 RepID=UPI0033267CEC